MNELDIGFEGFTSDDWVNWLSDAVAGLLGIGSSQPTDTEPHHVLGDIFESLQRPEARHSFQSALETILSGVSFTSNARPEIFTALQLVALVKPPAASRMLERRIYDGSLADLEYASVNLEDLALTVRSQFDMTVDFCSFLQTCISSKATRTRRFVAARCLSLGGPEPARSALTLLLQTLDGQRESDEQFTLLLRDIWLRLGGGLIFDWYNLVQANAPTDTRQKLDELLASRVLPWEQRQEFDAYGFLLSAKVNASTLDLKTADLIEMASLQETVGKERVEATLLDVWKILTENRGATEPWLSIDSTGLENVFRGPAPGLFLKYGADVQGLPGWRNVGLLLEEVGLQPPTAEEMTP